MEVLSSSSKETKDLAGRIAKKLTGGDVIALYGNLGSGKTTFTQGLLAGFLVKEKVVSPTFILMRHYAVPENLPEPPYVKKINHADLYRITSEEDAGNLGLEDMFCDADAITIIEWPEIFEKRLPKKVKKIRFEILGEGDDRRINLEGFDNV